MATVATKPGHDEDNDGWSGPKLMALGAATLLVAFVILHILSGTDCIPGFC